MITGDLLIDGVWTKAAEAKPSADLPEVRFSQADAAQVSLACAAARRDFRAYAATPASARARFLRAISEELDARGAEITQTAMAETGLPEARLEGERARTTGQLKMFADLIERTAYLDCRIAPAHADHQAQRRPDLRLTHRPIGPVAVFGASNFPLAFSTAGGDTASALAAGCPVIVKGHSAHAGTSELAGRAIAAAAARCKMPKAVFQLIQGAGRVAGTELVRHSAIRAVGFTGSTAGGRTLYDLCHTRPQPIPFFGELGSVNPVFCLPGAMAVRGGEIGTAWAASLTLGAGQFCTNPGVIIAVKGSGLDAFASAAAAALARADPQKMLTEGICAAYREGVAALAEHLPEITGSGDAKSKRRAFPTVFSTDAATWLENDSLQEEVFGPCGILVECAGTEEMLRVAEGLQGQLTATMHLDETDIPLAKDLAPVLEEKAGRILCNGFPTGVEVSPAMMHGGPYPASTDVRTTSVGTLAISRWLRPVSYQDMPAELLPAELAVR